MNRLAPTKLAAVLVVFYALASAPKVYGATVTTFTSNQAWQAAVQGSSQFVEDFSDFSQDTYFQTVPVSAGPFTLEQIGHDPLFGDFANFIDVPPLQFADNSGVTNASIYTKFGINTVDMTFSSPVFAWGATFYDAETGELENLILTAPGGGVLATVPVTVNTGFFGLVISPSIGISGITFQSRIDNPNPTVGQGFGLENVVGATVFTPEPTSMFLVIEGLALVFALACLKRRKRRSSPFISLFNESWPRDAKPF